MSQKKNEAYKEAKKNKRVNDKKAKRKKVFAWIIGIICALVLIGASVFLVYYTDVMLPKKQAEEATSNIDASDLIEMTPSENADSDDGNIVVETDEDGEADEDAEDTETEETEE